MGDVDGTRIDVSVCVRDKDAHLGRGAVRGGRGGGTDHLRPQKSCTSGESRLMSIYVSVTDSSLTARRVQESSRIS